MNVQSTLMHSISGFRRAFNISQIFRTEGLRLTFNVFTLFLETSSILKLVKILVVAMGINRLIGRNNNPVTTTTELTTTPGEYKPEVWSCECLN